jgi:hypothetical protein
MRELTLEQARQRVDQALRGAKTDVEFVAEIDEWLGKTKDLADAYRAGELSLLEFQRALVERMDG